MIGKNVSNFKILEKIGEGGMGVVYKAEDIKLHRKVALKFLPKATLISQNEKDRFLREAQAAAALNHPNIAHIYAVEEVDDQMFIAMEYIEGQNLHEIINSKQGTLLPLATAIDYTIQIAQGLKAAHDKNIVHRDVKSANMMVTNTGSVKIMDFGLAKLSNKSLLTQEGTTLGTVAYMSPEQAGGKSVDHRSDIWSLGVILYEILSGKLPFTGDYEQAVIYNIINSEPEPLTSVRSGLPIAVDGIITKCLSKDPEMRYQHVDEIPADLKAVEEIKTSASRIALPQETAPIQPGKNKTLKIGWQIQLLFAVVLITLTSLITFFLVDESSSSQIESYCFEITLTGRSANSPIAISPDGKSCAYPGTDTDGIKHLYISRFDKFETRAITDIENVMSPFYSPDGKWIGYFNGQDLKKVSLSGGTPILLGEARGFGTAHWITENEIIYSTGRGILKINAMGGVPDTLLLLNPGDQEVEYRDPFVLPNRQAVLYSVRVEKGWRTDVIDLETKKKKQLIEKGISARYIPTGHLVYHDWNEDALFVIPFDVNHLEVTGPPQRVLEQVRYIRSGTSDYSFSQNGNLFYSELSTSNGGKVCWVDKSGVITMISDLEGRFIQPRLSPDGKQLVVRKIGTHCQLWLYDIGRGTLSLLTMEGDNHDPVWSPDSRYIIFHRAEYGITSIFRQKADGSQSAELLAQSNGFNPRLSSLSSGKPKLLFSEENPTTGSDVLMLSLNEKREIKTILNEKFNESDPGLSPDGQWMTYTSDESGNEEVYLRPFARMGPKILVSKGGGKVARWAPDGKTIYYVTQNKMMSVPVYYEPEFHIGTPVELFAGDFFQSTLNNYDLTKDGQKFLMIYDKLDDTSVQNYRIVLHWFDELQQKLTPN
jgi:serine/threonine-protein kinase